MTSPNGQRRGTFELWQRTSREDPVAGYSTRQTKDGGHTQYGILMQGIDRRFGTLPEPGVSLLECFEALPGMLEILSIENVKSKIIRGKASVYILQNETINYKLILQPARLELRNELCNHIRVAPRDFERVWINEVGSGLLINATQAPDDPVDIILPSSVNWSVDELRFLPPTSSLNEFGLIYVGLYMLGNYARYFPDQWVTDVESGSPLAQVSEAFIDMAEWRMALLTYSDFSRRIFVPAQH
jgi:hypothetical protein